MFACLLLGAVLCPGALSVVFGSCAFRRCVLSCLPALCVFCCGVLLRGGVRRCALCRVRPGVSCCVFPVLSALCGVAVRPCSPLVFRSPVLCTLVLCCRVVLWCPVLPPCLVFLLCLFGFSYLKNRCKFGKIFLKKIKIVQYPTHAPTHTCRQQDHVCFTALHVAPQWWRCGEWYRLGGFSVVDLTPRTVHLQRKGGRSLEGGSRAGGKGTW